jgi:hypothetical protein
MSALAILTLDCMSPVVVEVEEEPGVRGWLGGVPPNLGGPQRVRWSRDLGLVLHAVPAT